MLPVPGPTVMAPAFEKPPDWGTVMVRPFFTVTDPVPVLEARFSSALLFEVSRILEFGPSRTMPAWLVATAAPENRNVFWTM